MTYADVLAQRRQVLGPNMALFFADQPLHIRKARGCELFDAETGASYLDCINNVSHVGHCHPRVASAVAEQMFTLNTNSRYLHEGLVTLARRLAATAPDPLSVVYPVVSGSEANDLAWRIACEYADALNTSTRECTGTEAPELHVACVDHGYHGHTSACIDISPYKFWGKGGKGKQVHVHVLPRPDVYRGKNLDGAGAAREAIAAAAAAGGRIAAFFCESILSCGGQIILPPGWLAGVYKEFKSVNAVCVADEVQCGFGRIGTAGFWAFETQGVVPDIITCGKPMGNGFPCAAVITTPTLAEAFSVGGMEFFATYGGCTAATAAALAVLDVLEDEKLQLNATMVGKYCMERLEGLKKTHGQVIGDVRGIGLMIGVEIVVDCASKNPAPVTAAWIKGRCKEKHRVLLSCEGPYANVLKIKPPMVFSRDDVDRMVSAIEESLDALRGGADVEVVTAAVLTKENEEAVAEVYRRRKQMNALL